MNVILYYFIGVAIFATVMTVLEKRNKAKKAARDAEASKQKDQSE